MHAHEFTMNVYGTMAARLAGVPAIATIHGRGYYAEAARRLAALRLAARAGAMFVAVSRDIPALPHRGGRSRRGAARRTGSTSSGRRPGTAPAAGRASGVAPGRPVIGTIRQPLPGERPSGAPRGGGPALAPGPRRHRRPRRGRGRAPAPRLGARDRGSALHLLGYRTDTADLLAAFDICALPSFSEGQSLALMEAMAAGLPIAATLVGGNSEVLGMDGESGIVPPGDPAALAQPLACLLGRRRPPRRLGAAARARARSSSRSPSWSDALPGALRRIARAPIPGRAADRREARRDGARSPTAGGPRAAARAGAAADGAPPAILRRPLRRRSRRARSLPRARGRGLSLAPRAAHRAGADAHPLGRAEALAVPVRPLAREPVRPRGARPAPAPGGDRRRRPPPHPRLQVGHARRARRPAGGRPRRHSPWAGRHRWKLRVYESLEAQLVRRSDRVICVAKAEFAPRRGVRASSRW